MSIKSYKLYLHDFPILKRECKSAGVHVEEFLSVGVTHVVVNDTLSPPSKIKGKADNIGAKVISAKAVRRWLMDLPKGTLSPPPPARSVNTGAIVLPSGTVVSSSGEETLKRNMVVVDVARKYRPIHHKHCDQVWYPDYPCNGSPFGRRNYNPESVDPAKRPNLETHAKKFDYCENCKVKVTDLEKHLNGFQHKMYAFDDSNFEELDREINDLTIDHLFGRKRRKVD